MKVAMTGHRPKDLGNEYDLRGPYSDYIRKEFQTKVIDVYHPEKIITGLADGSDQIITLLAFENNIPVLGVKPFEGQENKWLEATIKRYREILVHPLMTWINPYDYEVTTETKFWEIANLMQKRNEWMVDHLNISSGDLLVPIWNGNTIKSGTYNCLKYARRRIPESHIIYIDPRKAM